MLYVEAWMWRKTDPERRVELGNAGYAKTLAGFTWDRVVERLDRTDAEASVARQRARR